MNLTKEDWRRLGEAMNEVRRKMESDLLQNYKLIDQGDVDDLPWYTIQVQNQEVWFWLTQQEGKWHHYHCNARNIPLVNMEEKVYLALVMRWS